MQAVENTNALPLDWNEWRRDWATWLRNNEHRMRKVANPFRGQNLLADEILGAWKVNGRVVELSELTFPNLSERDSRGRLIEKRVRMIGITWATGELNGGAVVQSFAQLERELFQD